MHPRGGKKRPQHNEHQHSSKRTPKQHGAARHGTPNSRQIDTTQQSSTHTKTKGKPRHNRTQHTTKRQERQRGKEDITSTRCITTGQHTTPRRTASRHNTTQRRSSSTERRRKQAQQRSNTAQRQERTNETTQHEEHPPGQGGGSHEQTTDATTHGQNATGAAQQHGSKGDTGNTPQRTDESTCTAQQQHRSTHSTMGSKCSRLRKRKVAPTPPAQQPGRKRRAGGGLKKKHGKKATKKGAGVGQKNKKERKARKCKQKKQGGGAQVKNTNIQIRNAQQGKKKRKKNTPKGDTRPKRQQTDTGQGGRRPGKKAKEEKNKGAGHPHKGRANSAQRGPEKHSRQGERAQGSEAHQNAPRRPACPTGPRKASTRPHARQPVVASSDPKGEVSVSTRNSPGAPVDSPIERRTVPQTGRVSDRVQTRQNTAAQAAQDQRRKDPPGITPLPGPEELRHGASPVPLPRRGPAAGTMIPVLGQPPRAPRSRPVNPEAKAPSRGGHHGNRTTDRRTESDRTGRGAAHQCGAKRHAREAYRWPEPRHRTRCQATPNPARGAHEDTSPQPVDPR